MTVWSRTPLRIKLVATLLAAVAGALALSGFAAATSLRSYLYDRVDDQLVRTARDQARRRVPGVFDPRDRNPGLPQQYYLRVVGPSGAVNAETPLPDGQEPPDLPVDVPRGRVFGAGEWRAVALDRPDGATVLLARDVSDEAGTVRRLVVLELVIGATVLALLGALGYVLVRQSLRPLAEVEETAAAIAAGDLSRRVPEGDPRTEVGRLATALNAMLHQIEGAFRVRAASEQRMRRFLTDASHELRTPLTSIRGFAELYRQGAAGPEDVPRLMRRIEDEGARMGLLVDDLLLLARLDEERPLARDVVDLVRVAADAVHDARVLDPDRAVTLDAAEGTYEVVGDEPRLRQVLGNLLANALKHTPAGTPVEVRLRSDGGHAALDVADHGPGLAPEEQERVFERFYRADESRTRAEGGTGLGLAIVAALAKAHGGTVSAGTTPGGGATFTVRLPLSR
ncbi:MAG TPA: HAMP domain-containing sensor histidine kinase [Frankiaceae bacterium]|nr:HAMP domain-containing sensor histidine kinase [Frankiaceae bacterium]